MRKRPSIPANPTTFCFASLSGLRGCPTRILMPKNQLYGPEAEGPITQPNPATESSSAPLKFVNPTRSIDLYYFGGSYYNYSILPPNPIPIIKAPIVAQPVFRDEIQPLSRPHAVPHSRKRLAVQALVADQRLRHRLLNRLGPPGGSTHFGARKP